MHQNLFWADPVGEAYDAPPDPLVSWGGGYPLPIPHRATRSTLELSASVLSSPQHKILATPVISSLLFSPLPLLPFHPFPRPFPGCPPPKSS